MIGPRSAAAKPVRPDRPESNWAGNHVYAYRSWERPSTVGELAALVRGASQVRAVGSRHSFNAIVDSEDLVVDMSGLAAAPIVDADRRVVRVGPGSRFAEVARAVAAAGLALPNLGSLPHISVCGALATGTHGSGTRHQVLAASVSRLVLLDAAGDVHSLDRGDRELAGTAVGLGAAGLVLLAELDLVPTYDLVQTREQVGWTETLGDVADLLARDYSVSVFTRWTDEGPTEVQRKARVVAGGRPDVTCPSPPSVLLGDGPHLTEMDRPVAWWEALPHFRIEHQPSFGEEIQSEFFVPREHTYAALHALTPLAKAFAPHLLASELRSVAADDLWMSPAQGRDSTCIHFTWARHPDAVPRLTRTIQQTLAPYGARPHWGKVFDASLVDAAALYPRLPDFVQLLRRRDPQGRFRNPFLRRVLGI